LAVGGPPQAQARPAGDELAVIAASADPSARVDQPRDPDPVPTSTQIQPPLVKPGPRSASVGQGLRPLPLRVAIDLGDLAKLPAHAKGKAWAKFGLGLGLIGALYSADESVRTSLDPGQIDSTAQDIRPLGQEVGLAFIASAWAIGKLADKPTAFRIGRDGVEATLLAAGILSPLLKLAVGRERPRENLGHDVFSGSGESFPSGEVTEAFAIASVVSANSRRKWVKGLAWTLAGATAWQRLELDAHWASDVGAGALLGSVVGHWVVHRNRELWSLEPQISRKGAGITVSRSF
jgi:hypothetical protein